MVSNSSSVVCPGVQWKVTLLVACATYLPLLRVRCFWTITLTYVIEFTVCNSCTQRKINCACVLAELDPNNYMIFYRRATVYLAMGKSKSALPDLDVVLSLKPDFNAVCNMDFLFDEF